jgi:hypothetical protein
MSFASSAFSRTGARISSTRLIVWAGGRNCSLTTQQYARLLPDWLASVGLDLHLFGTRSLRRTKATVIYRRTTLSRALFKANAAHINFEINTDDPSCEGYIADTAPSRFRQTIARALHRSAEGPR